MFRTRFSFADVLVMLSVLLVAALLFFGALLGGETASERLLVIRTPSETLSYPLSSDSDRTVTITSGGYTLTVEISGGRARVSEADCPDRVCLHTGWISRKGETVICAPAAVRLTVTDRRGGAGDADSVIG
ncbi:MAG TPA: hypothetical protein DDW30_09490 [Clostridiales bacterium]|nr:hypothetical protein [Clostridiales bacterium]